MSPGLSQAYPGRSGPASRTLNEDDEDEEEEEGEFSLQPPLHPSRSAIPAHGECQTKGRHCAGRA